MKSFFAVTAIIISSQLTAQSSQQEDSSKTLDEVIFTANKFSQKQSNTGKVVTVITKEQLEKSPAKIDRNSTRGIDWDLSRDVNCPSSFYYYSYFTDSGQLFFLRSLPIQKL